jgi:Domain of unknown function (DUF4826)
MSELDYDDPEVEEQWCSHARKSVTKYLSKEGVSHGEVGEWPAWHVAPLVSVWAIESLVRPGWVGWWVLYGDLPTDYISADDVKHPRVAVAAFAKRWNDYVTALRSGQPPKDFTLGDGSEELVDLLGSRAATLAEWADDDDVWHDL